MKYNNDVLLSGKMLIRSSEQSVQKLLGSEGDTHTGTLTKVMIDDSKVLSFFMKHEKKQSKVC
jgi:hypothetical protein